MATPEPNKIMTRLSVRIRRNCFRMGCLFMHYFFTKPAELRALSRPGTTPLSTHLPALSTTVRNLPHEAASQDDRASIAHHNTRSRHIDTQANCSMNLLFQCI